MGRNRPDAPGAETSCVAPPASRLASVPSEGEFNMRRSTRRLLVVMAVVVTTGTAACGAPARPPAPPTSGLDPAGFDRSVRPGDDLFGFANGGWLRDTQIPPDMSEYGAFSLLSEQSE